MTPEIKSQVISACSTIERKFYLSWTAIEGPRLYYDYKFHTERKWRFDFAHLPSLTAIECEGGAWSRGRHTRGSGFIGDCFKYLEAALMGWTVIRLTSEQITVPNLERIAALIRKRTYDA